MTLSRTCRALGMALLGAWTLLLACSCGEAPAAPGAGGAQGAPRSEPIAVVATIGMIADVAREIGGPRVRVSALMGEGVDPHLYKASPGDLRLLSDADLVLYNGLHLEGRLADALVRLSSRTRVVQVTDSIPEERLREPPEFDGHFDPHVWFDVELWSIVAQRIESALAESDPAGRAHYAERGERYRSRLDDLHRSIAADLATIPAERRLLITAHDAFGYFGRAYGIEVMAIQGISTDSEASLRDMNALVDTLVSRRVPAVFVESSVPRKTIEALVEACRARGHTVTIGGELYSDAMGPDNTPEGTYIGMVRHNVDAVVRALGGAIAPASPAAQPDSAGSSSKAEPAAR